MAETQRMRWVAFDAFVESWGAKYGKAGERLTKDRCGISVPLGMARHGGPASDCASAAVAHSLKIQRKKAVDQSISGRAAKDRSSKKIVTAEALPAHHSKAAAAKIEDRINTGRFSIS